MCKFKTFESNPLNGGIQFKKMFENGYGCSIVQHSFSYGHEDGLWELAVLTEKGLCYTTPITDDVLGYLSETEVDEIVDKIKQLPTINQSSIES